MSDILTIGGSAITLRDYRAAIDLCVPYRRGGIPELHLSRVIGIPGSLPDAWSGQPVTLQIGLGPTLIFSGDIQGYVDRFMYGGPGNQLGWVREYRGLGLANRANYIPVTDPETATDTSIWNLPGDDPNFIPSRAGRNVGQIVTSILTGNANAQALYNAGIGAWASTSPWTLPTATVNDLAALTCVPPFRVSISGERILLVIENFVQSCHPKIWLHVQPDGTIRFFDTTAFNPNTLTLGTDARLGMPQLTRDFSDCYSQVLVRGNTRVEGRVLQTAPWPGSADPDGGLAEDFAWDGLDNAAAKAAWTTACWNEPQQNGQAADTGTCTVTDPTHVVVTSSDATLTWPADFWDQSSTGVLGNVMLYGDLYGGSAQQQVQRRVVANTALAAAGTSTLTLDLALNGTAYNAYQLWGLTLNCNAVWRKYSVTNPAIAQALLNFFPWPFPFVGANGNAAAMTTTPICQVIYHQQVAVVGITLDPVNGIIYLARPAYTIFNAAPDNVQVFVPVAVGALTAYAPSATTYSGTLYTVEGIKRTKVITVLDWKDYSNQSNMATFAQEYLTSVQDVVVEGSLPYYGLNETFLTPGQAVSIAASNPTYTTGWEALALPVVGVEIGWNNAAQGTSKTMNIHLSNRRGRYSAEAFLRPNLTHAQIAGETISAGGQAIYGGVAAVSGETLYNAEANGVVEAGRQQQAQEAAEQQERFRQMPARPGRDFMGQPPQVRPLMRRMTERRERLQRERLARTTGSGAHPRDEAAILRGLAATRREAEKKAGQDPDRVNLAQDPERNRWGGGAHYEDMKAAQADTDAGETGAGE